MDIWALCSCTEGHICSFCKIMVLICFIVLSGLVGYFVGRRKRKKEK